MILVHAASRLCMLFFNRVLPSFKVASAVMLGVLIYVLSMSVEMSQLSNQQCFSAWR
jgi:hypothetical protein